MRILHCLHASPRRRAAGVQLYTRFLASALGRQHEVALLYPASDTGGSPGGNGDAAPAVDGLRHFEIASAGPPRSFEATYRRREIAGQIEDALDTFRPEVIHVQHLMGLSSELPALAQTRNIPVVMTLHDHWLECAAGGQRFHRDLGRCEQIDADRCASCTAHLSGPALHARAWLAHAGISLKAPRSGAFGTPRADGARWTTLRRAVSTRAVGWSRVPATRQRKRLAKRRQTLLEMTHEIDRFLAPSDFVKDAIVAFGVPDPSVQRVDYALADLHHVAKRKLPDRLQRFGYLGSLAPPKGVHLLIDAVNHLPDQARLDVFGNPQDDPAYAASLRRRVSHPGIRFHGAIPPEEVPKRLREIECLVVPSIWCENAPLVVREAFCAGIAVVASRLGGHPELLSSGGGLLFDPEADGELARVLTRLMQQAGLARNLVARQPAVGTMEVHAGEMTAIYHDLVREFESPGSTPETSPHRPPRRNP